MQRVFTKDVGRFKKGDVRDYPKATWIDLGKPYKMKPEDFSKIAVMLETKEPVKPTAA